MNERGKKWLLWGSLVALVGSLAAMIISIYSHSNRASDILAYTGTPILILSILNLVVVFSLKFSNRKWLRNLARLSIFLLPIILLANFLLFDYINAAPVTLFKNLSGIFFIITLSLAASLSLIYIFLIREVGEIKGVLVILLIIVISIVALRIYFTNSYFGGYIYTFFMVLTVLTGCGMYMFGLRCLFQVGKNRYLKIVSFLACILIAFGSIVFAAIMSSERVDVLKLLYFVPAILLTLVVLLSLPVSGFINWNSLHKKILKKIMISWMFFFLIFSIHFVFPEYFKIIEIKEDKPLWHFSMVDYEIQNKNGLEP